MVKRINSEIPVVQKKGLFAAQRQFLQHPINFLAACQETYGNTFLVNFFMRKLFITSDPEAIKHVLQTNNKNYIKDFGYRQLKLALGNGLLMNEGESWMQQRRLAQPIFYKKRLNGLFNIMVDVVEGFCENLEQSRGQSEPINLTRTMNVVTSDVVIKTLLGGDFANDNRDIQNTINHTQTYIVKRIREPYTIPMMYISGKHRRFKKDIGRFDKVIYDIIDERKKSGEQTNDLLSMLLEARDQDTGEGMNAQQLRDEIITMYVAGHETSANALSWTWHLLVQHPDIYKKMKDEVTSVLGDRRPELEDLKAMQYTRQVIDESMRIYPPAWAVGREALDTDEVAGHTLKKGEICFISIYNLHHDPELWENPEIFNPDRFNPEAVKARPKGYYIPFGGGPRMCIGNHFALMEIHLLLACMIRRFDFEFVPEHPVEMEPLVTLRPKYGIRVKVK